MFTFSYKLAIKTIPKALRKKFASERKSNVQSPFTAQCCFPYSLPPYCFSTMDFVSLSLHFSIKIIP